MRGWVFVLSNDAVPGMVKIGSSLKDPALYAKELDKTPLPTPYVVGYEVLVEDPQLLEQAAGERLAHFGIGKNWFRCSVAEAARTLESVAMSSVLLETRYDSETIGDSWRRKVCSDDATARIAALSNPSCPHDILEATVLNGSDEDDLLAALTNPSFSTAPNYFLELVRRVPTLERVACQIATDPRTSVDVLCELSKTSDVSDAVLQSIAAHPRASSDLLDDLIAEFFFDCPQLAPLVIKHPAVTPPTLAAICWRAESDIELINAVRNHRSWSEQEFRRVLLDQMNNGDEISSWVAEHPACPGDLLETLARHPDQAVATAALRNPNCPPDILIETELLGSKRNATSDFGALADAAAENPANPLSQARDPKTSAAKLVELAKSDSLDVRLAVAEHRQCQVDVLRTLLVDWQDPILRAAVAGNVNCDAQMLEELASDNDYRVRRRVAGREDCPPQMLIKFTADKDARVRMALLENPVCPAEALNILAKSEFVEWRKRVAANPNCPSWLRAQLCSDPDPRIRKIARQKAEKIGRPQINPSSPVESLDVVRERFRGYVQRKLGAVLEEQELLRLSALSSDKKAEFASNFPSQAKQLALFEKHLLPLIRTK